MNQTAHEVRFILFDKPSFFTLDGPDDTFAAIASLTCEEEMPVILAIELATKDCYLFESLNLQDEYVKAKILTPSNTDPNKIRHYQRLYDAAFDRAAEMTLKKEGPPVPAYMKLNSLNKFEFHIDIPSTIPVAIGVPQ